MRRVYAHACVHARESVGGGVLLVDLSKRFFFFFFFKHRSEQVWAKHFFFV